MTSTADRTRRPAGIREGGQFATEARAEADVTLSTTARDWGSANVKVGSHTPWGKADDVQAVAPGIAVVGTPSHGGVKLSRQRNMGIPEALRVEDGWYEEDGEANIPMWVFPQEFADVRGQDAEELKAVASERVRDWWPEAWSNITGQAVTAEQSIVKAMQEHEQLHANDHVTVSAVTSSEHPGMVEVTTTIGGRRPGLDQEWQDMGQRVFLVPREEYNDDHRLPFVVDPQRHTDITPPPAPPKQPAARVHSVRVDHTGLTSVQKVRVDKDLRTTFRLRDGSVKTLKQVVEEDGVTGKSAWVDDKGRAHYHLHQKKHADSNSHTTFEVSKATFDALADIPDTRTEVDLAREAVRCSAAALEKARKARPMSWSAAAERLEKIDAANREHAAARAHLRELLGRSS